MSEAQVVRHAFGRVHTLDLPSGAAVRARRPSFLSLVRRGLLPQNVVGLVLKVLRGQGVTPGEDPAAAQEWAMLLDTYAVQALVEPRVYYDETCPEGGVQVSDLPDEDKFRVLSWVNGRAMSREEAEEAAARGEPAVLATEIARLEAELVILRSQVKPGAEGGAAPPPSEDTAEVTAEDLTSFRDAARGAEPGDAAPGGEDLRAAAVVPDGAPAGAPAGD